MYCCCHLNQNDIILGIPVANRHYRELEDMIGFFVNTLAIRIKVDDIALNEYIQMVSKEILEAQTHQELPFEKLVEELNIEKDTSLTLSWRVAK